MPWQLCDPPAKAATHNAAAGNATFLGDVVEIVEFFARHIVVFAQSLVGLKHLLSHGGIIVALQSIAHGEHALFLSEHVAGALEVFFVEFGLHALQLVEVAIAQGFDVAIGIFLRNDFHNVLATLAAVVIGAAH